jgi:hypothetical protein
MVEGLPRAIGYDEAQQGRIVNTEVVNLAVRFANSTAKSLKIFAAVFANGEPAGTRTQDPLIKSQVL